MPQHVRSWRKRTLHRHRNVVRKGQRITELEAEIDTLQRQAQAFGAEPTADFAPWVFTRGEDRPTSAFGGRRHAGAERGGKVWTHLRHGRLKTFAAQKHRSSFAKA
jgi:hypothetical protein